jgi:4-hydroxyacetophenone monooxygenase
VSLGTRTAAIDADDDTIRRALELADVPPLVASIAYATGDLSILRDEFAPDPTMILDPNGGVPPEAQAEARRLAFEALVELRDTGRPPVEDHDPDDLRAMVEFTVGGPDSDDYLPLFREELGIGGEDLRAPSWRKDDIAPGVDFEVAVIGAGMSGLLAAHRLAQAGVPFVVIEKNDDVGGTWYENSYPGCRVDVPNHFYSYSFLQREDWPQHFSTQGVLLDYFRRCADEFDLRDSIRFSTEVQSATFDDDERVWHLALRLPDGSEETIEVNAVVSAVGQLNRPLFPDIEGRDRFEGPAFHSAQWRHDVDLTGKRVAVIGTGASAVQLVPAIAETVGELSVFQRTPPWLVPTPDYHDEVAPELLWLFRHVPGYAEWYRFWLFWRNAEGMLPMVTVDPTWTDNEASVSAPNEMLRQLLVGYLQVEFADRPDLLEKVTPDYPPSSKRVIRDNGIWARTLKRDNVELVTEGIEAITPKGIRTVDGHEHEVDVIIYGTGFQASRFLTPMQVVGRGGVDLHERWHGDARAYLGITIPGFPNLFCLYGPNTNIVINGSIIYFSECEVSYVLGCIELLLRSGKKALDCRDDVHDAFNKRIDEGNLQRAWGVATVNSWYRNATGRSAQNWPFTLLEYWQETRQPEPSDYELL